MHGNTFSDNNTQRNFGVDRFFDRGFGKLRWDKHYGDICTRRRHCRRHVVEYRDSVNVCASLAGGNSGNDIRTASNHESGVFCPFGTGHSLNKNFAIFIEPNCHRITLPFLLLRVRLPGAPQRPWFLPVQ